MLFPVGTALSEIIEYSLENGKGFLWFAVGAEAAAAWDFQKTWRSSEGRRADERTLQGHVWEEWGAEEWDTGCQYAVWRGTGQWTEAKERGNVGIITDKEGYTLNLTGVWGYKSRRLRLQRISRFGGDYSYSNMTNVFFKLKIIQILYI